MPDIADYKLQLENFYGPLDLLLHLVREEEVPILEVPIARLTEQYIGFLELMKKLDINLAGEFLVMAATLMVIKARTLVPAEELEGEEEDDPRLELVRKLLEYKRFKDLARELARCYEDQSRRAERPYVKLPEKDEAEAEEEPVTPLDAWALVSAYARITKETNLAVPAEILYDVVPIEEIMADLMRRLLETKELLFSQVVGDKKERPRVVGNFLALLELTKQQQVETEQERDFADIRIRLREAPPAPASAPPPAPAPAPPSPAAPPPGPPDAPPSPGLPPGGPA